MAVMDYYYRGVDLMQQKDYDGAIEVFTTGLAEEPDHFSLLQIRGDTYHRKGDREKALADYTRMIAIKPQNPDGWNSRGNLYQELKEYDRAIADFTQCIPLSPPGYGTYWSNRGIVYYEKGDLDAALADLDKSIECWADPDCTGWARMHRGLVLRRKGELDRAMEDFTLAAAYEPEDDYPCYQAGYICFVRGELDGAIEWFSKAIAAKGDAPDNWLARGVCHWNKCVGNNTGFWDEEGETVGLAEEDFTRAIELSPDNAEALFNRGALRCSKARESNNLIKAILAQKAVDDTERTVMLAQLDRLGGRDLVPQADAILRGLRSNRDQVDVLMAKSFGLFAEDDAREAVEDLSRAIELEPDQPEAWYQRGLAYVLLGEKDKALADYDRTCALDPYHEKAAGKRAELRETRK